MNAVTTEKTPMTVRFPADVFTEMKEAAWEVRLSQNAFVVEAVKEKIAAIRRDPEP